MLDHQRLPQQNRRITDPDNPGASKRWVSIENRMDALEEKLDRNTEMTETIVKLFGTVESGFKVLGWLGAAAKWFVTITTAVAAVWAIVHGKELPDLPK